MTDLDKAVQTQLANIQKRTGKSLDDLYGLLRRSGLAKHGELRDLLKRDLDMGHGDANTLVTLYLRSGGGGRRGGGPPPPRRRRATSWTRSTPAPRRTCGRSTTS
jgi:hypothetical protein